MGVAVPGATLVTSHDGARRAVLLDDLGAAGLPTVLEAASAGEAALAVRDWTAGELALVDLGLPDGLAVPLVGTLLAAGWARVLVLAAPDRTDEVVAALGAGAHGVLVTAADVARDVVAVGDSGPGAGGPAGGAPTATLTPREREVLALVARGESNREIGRRTGISSLTVKAHLARIGHKLCTGDRAHMVALALRAGLIG